MQQIQLNIIPFKPVVDNQTFAFYGEKQKGFAPIYWDKLFESFPEGREAKHKNYYSDFQLARPGLGELIDKVYHFSPMYQKSISQQNLPVTTKDSEMVAEIFPHFEHYHLPEFGKENLWFL